MKNAANQPYAYSNTHWVLYEDYDHAKLEVMKIDWKYMAIVLNFTLGGKVG